MLKHRPANLHKLPLWKLLGQELQWEKFLAMPVCYKLGKTIDSVFLATHYQECIKSAGPQTYCFSGLIPRPPCPAFVSCFSTTNAGREGLGMRLLFHKHKPVCQVTASCAKLLHGNMPPATLQQLHVRTSTDNGVYVVVHQRAITARHADDWTSF